MPSLTSREEMVKKMIQNKFPKLFSALGNNIDQFIIDAGTDDVETLLYTYGIKLMRYEVQSVKKLL